VHESHPMKADIEANCDPTFVYRGHTGFIRQPVHGGTVQGAGQSRPPAGPRAFPINSKTSSSESTDRFKYDGEAYSTFLHPSSTRDTKSSMRRPTAASDERVVAMRTKTEPRGSAMHNKTAFYNPTAVQST
jgi:hypothetical protein